jgi:dTDP-glucose 4,6-dehydratase
MSKVLVIGSNSFSGQDFVRYAVELGDEVICVSRSTEKTQNLLGYDRFDVQFFQYDLNLDCESIRDIIKNNKINYVINFAAQSIVEHSWEEPDHWYNTNVTSLAKLFKIIRSYDFLDNFVQVSTPEVYGCTSRRILPSKDYKPTTPYAASKAAGDIFMDMYSKQFDIPLSFVRSSNVFGRYQQFFKIIPKCIASILLGKKLPLHGGGRSSRDFIHINDVSAAEYRVLIDGKPNGVYHISTEKEVTIADLVRLICNRMGVVYDDVVDIVDDRPGKDSAYILDSSSIRELGWKPEKSLTDGIDEVVEWLQTVNISKVSLNYEHKQ